MPWDPSRKVIVRATTIATLAAALGLGSGAPSWAQPSGTPGPPPTQLSIATEPALRPAFDPAITDYVARCTAVPVIVDVEAPIDTTVSVDRTKARSGRFTESVRRETGQRFSFTTRSPGGPRRSYDVRCLPKDFPGWTSERTGTPQAEWYLVSSVGRNVPGYAVIYDTNGVPVWWSERAETIFTRLLPDNSVLEIGLEGPVTHTTLDGEHLATVDTETEIDPHDALLRPNGNFVVVDNVPRPADFDPLEQERSRPELPADTKVLDHVFQEVTPDGDVVWRWRMSDHIDIAETTPAWHGRVRDELRKGKPGDTFHWNSIEEVDDGYLLSTRHQDAIYKVAKDPRTGRMGEVVWKLGGTHVPGKSLKVVGDPLAPAVMGGQHDARWDPATSSVTIYDNGSPSVRAPRATRYLVDEVARTATLQEAITNPEVPWSRCCGSVRRLPGGNWVFGWGALHQALVTEQAPDGSPVFRLESTGQVRMYRALPIPPGQVDRATLVAAMDARHA